MSTKIYASELSPFGARLRLAVALKQLDIPFEPPPGGSGSAEMKILTPYGRIPVLLEGERVLVESLALLEYLEDSRPESISLRPHAAVEAARMRMVSLLFDHNVVKALGGVFVQFSNPAPERDAVQSALNAVEGELARLVPFFDAAGPAVGGRLSLADCALMPFAHLIDTLSAALDCESPTQKVPRFRDWWTHMRGIPEVLRVMAGMSEAFEALLAAKRARGPASP